jgi:hypothetical protein
MIVATNCVGLSFIPLWMQRAEMRKKYQLEGSCLTDLAMTCCCALCSLCQQDQEAAFREEELAKGGAAAQYQNQESMNYAPKA